MSSGVQDASIGGFLQYVEEKGLKAYSSLTGLGCGSKGLSHCLRHEMNLLYRKTKVEWKQRDEEPKKRSGSKLMEMSKPLVPQSG